MARGYAREVKLMRRCKTSLLRWLHILKVKGRRIGLEEIVADPACEVEAKSVFPREWSIVDTRDVFFLYVSERKLTHGVRHDFCFPPPSPFGSFVFLELDPGSLATEATTTRRKCLLTAAAEGQSATRACGLEVHRH
jgi:hypothetical protein